MADNPFESMLPYQQTSAYKTRVLEVARLMMEHQRGITLPQVTNKMRQIMEINIKQLFEERRSRSRATTPHSPPPTNMPIHNSCISGRQQE